MQDLWDDHAGSSIIETVLAREGWFDDVAQATSDDGDESPDPGLHRVVLSKSVRDRVLIEFTRTLIRDIVRRHFEAIAKDTRQRRSEPCGPAFDRDDPWADHERRTVTNVLTMSAAKLCDPIPDVVLMEPFNLALHSEPNVRNARAIPCVRSCDGC